MTLYPCNWVTVERFCAITGYTEDAVDKKRANGVWLEGSVWKKAKDGRILMSIEGYEAWVEGKECAPQAPRASASRSNTAGRAAGRN